mmetsp:Transcript_18014/g.58256  ORF Transcript_18014/g.58256 Transcript_18014/m.58256 type:complete len:171 (-) Transcript_18014:3445-3957(-)
MGIFTGTLFRGLDYDDFAAKFGFIFSAILYLCLASMAAMPPNLERRDIFSRHRDLSFYPTVAFAGAQVALEVAFQVAEGVAFTTLAYWPAGLAPVGFGHFLGILASLSTSQLYGDVAAVAPSGKEAQPLAGFFVVSAILFSGFVAHRGSLPRGWRRMYWLSPMASRPSGR